MRHSLILLVATLFLALVGGAASADDGLRWRRTTPRALVEVVDGALSLRVPPGRAWGVESAPLAIEAGISYRAQARLIAPGGLQGAVFLRVALYERTDGRRRQRALFDSHPALAGEAVPRSVEFVAPAWARAAKLRLLVRQRVSIPEQSAVRAAGVELRRGASPPAVILREVALPAHR